MNIKDISLNLFDRKTVMVLYDKASKLTVYKQALYEKIANPTGPRFIRLQCDASGTLNVVSVTTDIPTGFGFNKPYEFNYASPSQSTGHDVFFTDSPEPQVVVGVGDIRNLADMNKTAHLHKFNLINEIVLTSSGDNKVTVYYKNASDLDTTQVV